MIYENILIRSEQLQDELLLLQKVMDNNELTDEQRGDIEFRIEQIKSEVDRMIKILHIIG